MRSEVIKSFYDRIQFPGHYTHEQLRRYDQGIKNIYLRFIDQYMDHGQTVLDAGCGTGLITNVFAARYRSEFTAVDFADGIKYGQQYAKDHSIGNAQWRQQDLTQLDDVHRYDRVICQGVLHHIPDYTAALSRIKAALKPGGILLLGLYNPGGKILKRLISLDYRSDVLYQDQEKNPFELAFTVREVKSMCSDLEFLDSVPRQYKYCPDVFNISNSVNGGLILYAFRKKNV